MKIDGYYIGGPVEGICKRHGLWATSGGKSFPLVYFQKPKGIPDAAFAETVEEIRAGVRPDLLEQPEREK